MWRKAPALMLLGVVPALIVGTAFIFAIVAIGLNLEFIAGAITPFANEWDEPYRVGVRVLAGLAFLAAAILLLIYLFTTVTLIVGEGFYERIWRDVEGQYGPVPDAAEMGFWKSLGSGIADGLRMLVPTALIGVSLFLLGFIPLAGTAIAAVLGALVGGWFLAVELTGFAFNGRGWSLRERRRALRGRRAMTVGFGVATYLLFFVPLGAILVMPAAVAGATLLSRRVLGESNELAAPNDQTANAQDRTAS